MFERMAMWTWPGAIRNEDPRLMVDRLRAGRVDTIVPYICSREGGDGREAYEQRLRAITKEAHRRGMRVYACFDEINAYEAMPVYDLRQVRKDGSFGGVLCPAHPDTVAYILGELERVLTAFEYDGINLEDGYIFNRNTIYDPANQGRDDFEVVPVCYCRYCREHAPIEQPEWLEWRCARLTALIAAEAERIRKRKPGLPFSVAARMPYDIAFYEPHREQLPYFNGWRYCQSRDSFSADWADWLKRGHIDFACPMSYYHSRETVRLQTQEARRLAPDPERRIWMGLGLGKCTAEYRQPGRGAASANNDPGMINDASALGALLEDQRSLGQKNVIFFAYEHLMDEHLPVMAEYAKG